MVFQLVVMLSAALVLLGWLWIQTHRKADVDATPAAGVDRGLTGEAATAFEDVAAEILNGRSGAPPGVRSQDRRRTGESVTAQR